MKSGKKLKFLIDTGSNKNYIQKCYIRNPIPNKNSFLANSVGGQLNITHHSLISLPELSSEKIKFFILPELKSFDGIIGNDTLKNINATIHTDGNYMTITKKIHLRQNSAESVNAIDLRVNHLDDEQKKKIQSIIKQHKNLLSEPNEKLTYTTVVKGKIRTTTEEPVYSKSYPYPMCLKKEVEAEIQKLLKDDIIRPSRSPYNSPIWMVPKKIDASGEKKYRLVIDYRKLNSITVPDRYPIPDINDVLANLGKNKFFSTIDLKSGFHQIPLDEPDIEKTAFSIKSGKYEFTRLPFGLKNAPSIFQRTLDDILREHIGERCYVYIDDIIIFGKNEIEHYENLEIILKTIEEANMKIQIDKCEFMKDEVEFLGFIITQTGIKANQKKVQAIVEMLPPKTVKELRSFLGMAGYYRRFIKDFAKLAKPLTYLLRGEDGHVSRNQSKTKKIHLDNEAIESFSKLKNSLMSKEVILSHPNFDKDFELTTDASDYAIGAVLSQGNKPIQFLSRTLIKAEENYATNEKEMLAIIWALNSLRNFLYGSKKVKIFTDHQPLTYALSNKNTNSKMKRWKAILEEYNYELHYKPGKTNIVADALSRPQKTNEINALTSTQHSSESSSHNLIPLVNGPINVFRNQIILKIGNNITYDKETPFPNFTRHIFTKSQYSESDLISILKEYLSPTVTNGLNAEETIMGKIQTIYPLHLKNYKVRQTQNIVEDVLMQTNQDEIILKTHQRAHRNSEENRKQILEKYYFPQMNRKIKFLLKQCTICKENKYERHPNNQIINSTPIPNFPGHIIHIDIYSTEKKLVLTALDKFSKLAYAKVIKSRAIEDIRRPLRELLFYFNVPENVIIDNEKSLNSLSITSMMVDELKIKIFKTPSYKSEINGQVERFHSTLSEIMQCLKAENVNRTFEELLERSVYEYNFSIHSVTGKKPIEIFYGRVPNINPEDLEKIRSENIERIKLKQQKDIDYHNKRRSPIKNYNPGETIYVKHNVRLGSKLTARYKKEIVKENGNTIVITESGKTIHKSHIRN